MQEEVHKGKSSYRFQLHIPHVVTAQPKDTNTSTNKTTKVQYLGAVVNKQTTDSFAGSCRS